MQWNGGWPTSTTTSSLGGLNSDLGVANFGNQVIQALNATIGAFDTDQQWLSGLNALSASQPTYMAAVSPWFFTHYGPQSYNKNVRAILTHKIYYTTYLMSILCDFLMQWIYLADYHLYPTRWETLVDNRNSVDIAEIVTWNDYGESHYIGPIEGAQPNSQGWVDGFNHTGQVCSPYCAARLLNTFCVGWLDMTNYYATAFKTGSYPAITEDKLYMWARPHPKDANAPDPVPQPTNFQLVSPIAAYDLPIPS